MRGSCDLETAETQRSSFLEQFEAYWGLRTVKAQLCWRTGISVAPTFPRRWLMILESHAAQLGQELELL